MFDWFTKESDDAVSQLKNDHDKVKDLFDQFEKEDSDANRKKIARQALTELKIHAALEEEIFYPAVRKELETDVMNEADEEHHVAHLLIEELEKMNGRGDHYDAKFVVLAENVRHHIKEEEGEMLPEARRLEIDFEKLGQVMLRRRKQLMEGAVPARTPKARMTTSRTTAGRKPANRSRKRDAA